MCIPPALDTPNRLSFHTYRSVVTVTTTAEGRTSLTRGPYWVGEIHGVETPVGPSTNSHKLRHFLLQNHAQKIYSLPKLDLLLHLRNLVKPQIYVNFMVSKITNLGDLG